MILDNHHQNPSYWIIVPAAGVGERMGAAIPKQYLPLAHKVILEHTLERLLQLPDIAGICLVLGEHDKHWQHLRVVQSQKIKRVSGGAERCDSVLRGLAAIDSIATDNDWVLVHDAARPCITIDSIQFLIHTVAQHPVGGILGIPVSDTLKRVDEANTILSTVDRQGVWQAQTPQLFRYGLLRDCLTKALAQGKKITDEASALESCGYQPIMVQGRSDNIKITRPEDLALAECILHQQSL